jgi:hypothetical protein
MDVVEGCRARQAGGREEKGREGEREWEGQRNGVFAGGLGRKAGEGGR